MPKPFRKTRRNIKGFRGRTSEGTYHKKIRKRKSATAKKQELRTRELQQRPIKEVRRKKGKKRRGRGSGRGDSKPRIRKQRKGEKKGSNTQRLASGNRKRSMVDEHSENGGSEGPDRDHTKKSASTPCSEMRNWKDRKKEKKEDAAWGTNWGKRIKSLIEKKKKKKKKKKRRKKKTKRKKRKKKKKKRGGYTGRKSKQIETPK